MALHDVELKQQIERKRLAVLIAEELRETIDRLGLLRQAVGLFVGDHLQPMLDPPQELIGRAELVARVVGDPVAHGEHVERDQRLLHPQLGMTAARDQLLGLGEELDLANAAAPDLDVMSLDRDLALAAIDLHLPLHVVHVGERLEVEMLAPDEGRQLRQQRLARSGVAGADPRLDHRGALPGAPFPLVVMQRCIRRHRDLRRGRIGPQPQIDPEHVAVGGALLQQPRHALGDAHKERLRLDVARQVRGLAIEEHDEVDVAGIVQLARAHLAHRQHEQAATLLGVLGVFGREPAADGLLAQQIAQRCLHRGKRDVGQRRRHLHHRPDPADVAERGHQRGFRLHPAQQPHHIGFAAGRKHFARGRLDQAGEVRLRVASEQADESRGVGADQVEQVGRELGDAEQDGAGLAVEQVPDRGCLRRLELGQPFLQPMFGFLGVADMRAGHETRGQG